MPVLREAALNLFGDSRRPQPGLVQVRRCGAGGTLSTSTRMIFAESSMPQNKLALKL